MFRDLVRNYKEREPEHSIKDIKDIFDSMGIRTEIARTFKPMDGVYSHRVEIYDGDVGLFGANGKGKTEAYSLASAYAELMERVQNNFFSGFDKILLHKLKKKTGFFYYPDERNICYEEFINLPEKVLGDCVKYKGEAKERFVEDMFKRLNETGAEGLVGVPFYDTLNKRAVNIPFNLIFVGTGSNGMAAGNTTEEAVFQALCELMERWCASRVFYEQLTPPTVPGEFLEQFEEEYSLLKTIENKGYEVVVKDFSAGWGMPALGLLVIDRNEGKYQLNVGCESNFNIALSRCITEMYQGKGCEDSFRTRLLDIPEKELDMFVNDTPESLVQRKRAFQEFTKDNSGRFPFTLFGEEADYSFKPEVFTSTGSYKEEIENYIELFHRRGKNVYLRDTSWLGFPSVFVYIPEVSFMGKKSILVDNSKRERFPLVELDRITPLVYKLRSCSNEELYKVARGLEPCVGAKVFELFNIKLKDSSESSELPVIFLVALIWYKIGEFDKALSSFRKFYEDRDERIDYYDLVEIYLEKKSKGASADSVLTELKEMKHYSNELIDAVCNDLRNPEDVLDEIILPVCPDCANCDAASDCKTRIQFEMSVTMIENMKSRDIVQKGI